MCDSWVVHGYNSQMKEVEVKGKEVLETYRIVIFRNKNCSPGGN